MAIKHWHVGKIVLLWAWGLVFLLAFFNRLRAAEDLSSGGLALLGILVIPIALSAVTWRWLSGKEQR